jgi:hypothetical protein
MTSTDAADAGRDPARGARPDRRPSANAGFASPHVVTGTSASVLARVREPGVNLAIWLRDDPERASRTWPKRRAAFDDLSAVRVAVDAITAAEGDVAGRVLPAGLPEAVAGLVRRDVNRLVRVLRSVVATPRVRVKLHRCDGDECRLFHVDHIGVRLITTYAGPGTDWVEDGAVRRQHLGGAGVRSRAPVTINDAIVADWTRVHRIPRFAVAAFRGGRAPAGWSEAAPIVHRSPPIAGTGVQRLRLVIDAADDADSCGA